MRRQAATPAAEPAPTAAKLRRVLRERFGFSASLPHQEAICTAVAAGSDALVVMPTGFRIFSYRTLLEVAAHMPGTLAELGSIRGIGPKLLERYGDELLALVRRAQ